MHIGILEDDAGQTELYQLWLAAAQHTCTCTASVRDFVAALQRERFDLLIVDWMLPESSGAAALQWVRENLGWELPVLFVTARDAEVDIVTALQAGADDYLVKPPKMKEMLSRVKLLELFWGLQADVDTRTVDTHVSRIRRKLEIGPAHGWQIVPVHGWGYRMEKVSLGETADAPVAAEGASPAPTPASLLERFLPLAGIDIADGMERTLGNEQLYLRMLVKFRDGQRDFAEQFAAARSDGKAETDVRVAHDLKSNAGNIGAKAVQLAAAKLEVACMEGLPPNQIDGLLAKVLDELAPVLAALDQVESGAAPASTATTAGRSGQSAASGH